MPSRHATSLLHDTRTAGYELLDRLEGARADAAGSPAAVLLVASYHHRAALPEAFELMRASLRPQAAVGVTAVGVVGGGRLHEGIPSMAAMVLDEPGLSARSVRVVPEEGPPATWSIARRRRLLAGEEAPEATNEEVRTLLWADPFSSDPPGLAAAGEGMLVHGGVLSGSSQAGGNLLLSASMDREAIVSAEGAVGLALRGGHPKVVAAPGARPIGPTFVVTASDGVRLLGLGGRPVLEVLREVLESTGDPEILERQAPMGGLAIGIVVDEQRPDGTVPTCRLRPLTGISRGTGTESPALRLAEPIRPGRTVRFHLRDRRWAGETLRDRLRGTGTDLAAASAAIVAVSTARDLERPDGAALGDGESASDPQWGGPTGVGLRTAGEFVTLAGRSEIDTLAASMLVFEGPPSLA